MTRPSYGKKVVVEVMCYSCTWCESKASCSLKKDENNYLALHRIREWIFTVCEPMCGHDGVAPRVAPFPRRPTGRYSSYRHSPTPLYTYPSANYPRYIVILSLLPRILMSMSSRYSSRPLCKRAPGSTVSFLVKPSVPYHLLLKSALCIIFLKSFDIRKTLNVC